MVTHYSQTKFRRECTDFMSDITFLPYYYDGSRTQLGHEATNFLQGLKNLGNSEPWSATDKKSENVSLEKF